MIPHMEPTSEAGNLIYDLLDAIDAALVLVVGQDVTDRDMRIVQGMLGEAESMLARMKSNVVGPAEADDFARRCLEVVEPLLASAGS